MDNDENSWQLEKTALCTPRLGSYIARYFIPPKMSYSPGISSFPVAVAPVDDSVEVREGHVGARERESGIRKMGVI